jgi:hypothetical protein
MCNQRDGCLRHATVESVRGFLSCARIHPQPAGKLPNATRSKLELTLEINLLTQRLNLYRSISFLLKT